TPRRYTLSLHDALPILAGLVLLQIVSEIRLGLLLVHRGLVLRDVGLIVALGFGDLGVRQKLGFLSRLSRLRGLDHGVAVGLRLRSEEHTSELQSLAYLV